MRPLMKNVGVARTPLSVRLDVFADAL